MCIRIGRKRRLRRSSPPPPQLPAQPPASFGYADGAWITRRDLLTVLGALDLAALCDAAHGSGAQFGRFRSLSRALGDDR